MHTKIIRNRNSIGRRRSGCDGKVGRRFKPLSSDEFLLFSVLAVPSEIYTVGESNQPIKTLAPVRINAQYERGLMERTGGEKERRRHQCFQSSALLLLSHTFMKYIQHTSPPVCSPLIRRSIDSLFKVASCSSSHYKGVIL